MAGIDYLPSCDRHPVFLVLQDASLPIVLSGKSDAYSVREEDIDPRGDTLRIAASQSDAALGDI